MPKAEYTDTQRLDWLTSKGGVEIEDEYMGPVSVMQSGDVLGKGGTLRKALDAAMRKARVKPVGSDAQHAEPTVELHVPVPITKRQSALLVDGVCRLVTRHDIPVERVKIACPDVPPKGGA